MERRTQRHRRKIDNDAESVDSTTMIDGTPQRDLRT